MPTASPTHVDKEARRQLAGSAAPPPPLRNEGAKPVANVASGITFGIVRGADERPLEAEPEAPSIATVGVGSPGQVAQVSMQSLRERYWDRSRGGQEAPEPGHHVRRRREQVDAKGWTSWITRGSLHHERHNSEVNRRRSTNCRLSKLPRSMSPDVGAGHAARLKKGTGTPVEKLLPVHSRPFGLSPRRCSARAIRTRCPRSS